MARAPASDFWWQEPGWRSHALMPAAWAYGAIADRHLVRAPRQPVDVPVLCVGNFTVGGEGKTPVALALAGAAAKTGLRPGFLSRGHGGRAQRSGHLVNLAQDAADRVGDEAMLLASQAPTAVSPDRAASAKRLLEEGCDFIIMDDGFQSARIHIDYALLVVDAARGLGNGRVIPAGPLRASVAKQLLHANALLRMGDGDGADALIRRAARAGKPVLSARVVPVNAGEVEGRRLFAFCGIGNAGKFFHTLSSTDAEIAGTRAFADHHVYTDRELAELEGEANALGAGLVTTTKDAARLAGGSTYARNLLERSLVLEVGLVFADQRTAPAIIRQTVENAARRLYA